MIKRFEAKLIRLSQAFFYFLTLIVHLLVYFPFLRLKLIGKENIPKKGRFILAANHNNFYDGFFLAYSVIPFKRISFLIAKRSVRSPFLQYLAWLIGSVLIGNEAEEYQKSLKKLNKILSHGGAVGIFPEGDVSNKKIPKKFKGGVAKLSLDTKTKVIPVYINGTYGLRNFKYWLERPEITLRFGKPLELYNFAAVCGNNLDLMAENLREKIIELIDDNKQENLNFSGFESTVSAYNKTLQTLP